MNDELIFNIHLSIWHKILLLLGWHIQVRTCGPLAQWGVTRQSAANVISALRLEQARDAPMSEFWKDPVAEILDKRLRDTKQPNFCFSCNGSGRLAKPISEWSDSEHEYNACPRTEFPSKICPACNGTGKITA